MRDRLMAKIQALAAQAGDVPPVVSIENYFEGNCAEGCIAPNQVDEGLPSLKVLYRRLREIQARPDVQAVLVGIHGDWRESLDFPDLWPAAENIHIYTTASSAEVERWISGLAAAGVLKGWPYGKHPCAPDPEPGFQVHSVCWD